MGAGKHIKRAVKHRDKLPRITAKTMIIAAGVFLFLGLLLVGLLIALIIWLVGVFSSSDTATQVIDTAQQTTNQVVEDNLQGVQVDPLAYIENGQVDTSALQEQIQALSPQQLVLFTQQFTNQVNELLETGQIVQEQAEQFQQLVPEL